MYHIQHTYMPTHNCERERGGGGGGGRGMSVTRYPKLYYAVAQHMDAVPSLCGTLVVHVYCMPHEFNKRERERERKKEERE